MAQIDIVDPAAHAYRTLWRERGYILKLALVPLLVKLGCYIAVLSLGYQTMYLRQTLIMIPSFFLEGWLVAQFLRTLLTGERWPVALSGDEEKDIPLMMTRARAILGCILLYVLTKMAIGGVVALLTASGEAAEMPAPEQPADPVSDMPLFVIAFVLLGILIYLFRFLWLYVPAIVNQPIMSFIAHMNGFTTSLRMLGIWLLCAVPILMIDVGLSGLVLGGADSLTDAPPASQFIVVSINIVFDTLISLLAATAMAVAFSEYLTGRKIEYKE